MKEFEIIDNYFYKLISKKEALDLRDDCAVFCNSKQIVVNVDTIIENEHFLSQDPASSIAYKLLNVNLSDISAMGATPKYWTMAISIPSNRLVNDIWMKDFCDTLKEIQDKHNFHLISGDTTFSKNGMLTITANVFGEVDKNVEVLKKSSAKEGDIICISGFIGDSYWGLQVLQDKYNGTENIILHNQEDKNYLIKRYQYPEARIKLGETLLNYASSCTDISDGLWADIEKMCRFSNCLGVIDANFVPLSNAVKNIKNIDDEDKLIQSICGGDDYELAFCVSKDKFMNLQKKLSEKNIFLKKIGYITKIKQSGKHVIFLKDNKEIYTRKTGYNY